MKNCALNSIADTHRKMLLYLTRARNFLCIVAVASVWLATVILQLLLCQVLNNKGPSLNGGKRKQL